MSSSAPFSLSRGSGLGRIPLAASYTVCVTGLRAVGTGCVNAIGHSLSPLMTKLPSSQISQHGQSWRVLPYHVLSGHSTSIALAGLAQKRITARQIQPRMGVECTA